MYTPVFRELELETGQCAMVAAQLADREGGEYISRGGKKDLWSIGMEEMDEVKSKDRVGRMWVTLGDISMGGGILQIAKKLYGVINL